MSLLTAKLIACEQPKGVTQLVMKVRGGFIHSNGKIFEMSNSKATDYSNKVIPIGKDHRLLRKSRQNSFAIDMDRLLNKPVIKIVQSTTNVVRLAKVKEQGTVQRLENSQYVPYMPEIIKH